MKFNLFFMRLTTFVIAAAIFVSMSGAQVSNSEEAKAETAPNDNSFEVEIAKLALKPQDLSSPRATLQSFLTNVDIAIRDGRRNALNAKSNWAYLHAVETLDLSATPYGDSWGERSERLLLLKEILDRIELPPESEIPGDGEVAEKAITQWTIPNTRITISQIEEGPRAGQFLFSARTVQQLGKFYRQAKPLPYKPGASVNAYQEYLDSIHSGQRNTHQRRVNNLLRGPDISNPRSTLESFLYNTNRAYELVMEAEAALTAAPPTMTRDQAREVESEAHNLLKRARSTLDLSQVPKAFRGSFSVEAVLQMKEVIDRTALPQLDTVPDALMVKVAREGAKGDLARTAGPIRWKYPDTEIEIVEIMEGERTGQFLFSADTVSGIGDTYEKVRDLPYRIDVAGGTTKEYLYPGISKGFYIDYISTPGYLIPHANFLGGWLDGLPDWFYTMHGGQTRWQWIALLVCAVAVALAAYVVFRIIRRLAGRLSTPWNDFLLFLTPTIIAIIVLYVVNFIDLYLRVTGKVIVVVQTVGEAIVVIMMVWAVIRLCKAVAEMIIVSPKIDPEGIQASYIRALFGLIAFLGTAAIIINGLSSLGFPLIPLLTGLGIGGLAFALAARPTLENIISSFMIFLDKPYRVGQRVNVLGQDGTVEAIGLRSTKIRLLTGHLTSIPNEKMAAVEVVNIGRRPHIRRLFNITITYDTPPEKINLALEILREILAVPEAPDEKSAHATTKPAEKQADTAAITQAPPALAMMIDDIERDCHPNVAINQPDFEPRVSFNEFNADSLNILVIYWYHPPEYWKYLDHATWINTQIVERFNAEGIDFAFPTQTLHLAGDDKRSLDVGQRQVSQKGAFSDNAGPEQGAVRESV